MWVLKTIGLGILVVFHNYWIKKKNIYTDTCEKQRKTLSKGVKTQK